MRKWWIRKRWRLTRAIGLRGPYWTTAMPPALSHRFDYGPCGESVTTMKTIVTTVILFNLTFDWDSMEMMVWIGSAGFRVWWQFPRWMDMGESSGVSLFWGRVSPLEEGVILMKHEETHEWICKSPRMAQKSIAGEGIIVPEGW